ncbi:MAG: peptidoglycan DD-metalloendopeptidase family protein [Thermoanaerobaculia bacterium]
MLHCHRAALTAAALVLAIFLPASAFAQSGTGQLWEDFGPWNSNGVFTEITRVYEANISAYAVASDPTGRVLTLAEWQDAEFDLDLDCAVTRHTANARTLDMDYTGELEGTRRIALQYGGSNDDFCRALAVDASSRAVIVGRAGTPTVISAFVARLRASDGDFDDSFSSDGKFKLSSLAAFANDDTRFEDVQTYADGRILACGSVFRGTDRRMLVARFLSSGPQDLTFNSTGYREIDFGGTGNDGDECSRILLLPDGRIVLAGTSDGSITGNLSPAAVRLLADGTPDTSFSSDGKVVLDDGTSMTSPKVNDVGWDAARQRLIVAGTTSGIGGTYGTLIALTASGGYDPTFDGDGRRDLRFSDFGTGNTRDSGSTQLLRILVRGDGRLYLAGTHENSSADETTFGRSDVAIARLLADGADDTTFSYDGNSFFAYSGFGHTDVPTGDRREIDDTLKDAIFYRGNVLLLSDSNRYPAGTWSGTSYSRGPIAPVLAAVTADRIWNEDWEFDGLAEPTNSYTSVPVPAGYGRYCSVLDYADHDFGLLAQGASSDPCSVMTDANPNAYIVRSGLYSLAGPNNVLAVCDGGGYIGLHPGNGTTPFSAAFAAASGRDLCIFTASPQDLPVFNRPYSGAHTADSAQSFNHDVFRIDIDVTAFGQTPNPNHPLAHYIDLHGIQKCDAYYGHDGVGPIGGVDEPAIDILVGDDRDVRSMAAGRVASAVPRFVLRYTPVGNDPHQREVFVRHSIGTGRYSEQFTSYYAHMTATLVRRGDVIPAGTVLGPVGHTGAAYGDHLHISVARNKNLSYRVNWEHGYAHVGFDVDKGISAIDPWGWRGPAAIDPWAWRFRTNDLAGSWSINLWKPGEEPTMD